MTISAVVGVDIGSTAMRAVAVARSGEVVASSSQAVRDRPGCLPPGAVDPSVWLEALGNVIGRLAGAIRIRALCIGGQGPTTVALSGEQALTYRHPSGANERPVPQHAAQAEELIRQFGPGAKPRLMWDFLLARLGGASGVQSVWPEMSPLPGFGTPVPVGSSVGKSSGAYGIPAGISLVPGANDAFLTSWGCAIDTPGRGFDPGGRSGGLGVAVADGEHRVQEEDALPGHVAGIRIVGGPVASHGAMLEWWADLVGCPISDLLGYAADVPPGSNGVAVLPFLEGERAPRWEPGLRAEVTGLRPDTGKGAITRALLEAAAYGLAHIADDLAGRGVMLDRVVCSGSPSKSNLWTSIKAAVLGVPFDVPDCVHMAAYGAALCAGSSLGWWPLPGDGNPGDWPTPGVRTFDPEPLPVYEEGLRRFIDHGDEATARLHEYSNEQWISDRNP